MKPGVETLARVPLFSTLDTGVLKHLSAIGDLARFGPNDEIFPENAIPQEIVLLLSGIVATTHSEGRRERAVIDVVLPVTLIGCHAALLRQPAPHGAHTIASSRCLLFPAAEFALLAEESPHLFRRIFSACLQETSALQKELTTLKLHSAVERLAFYLLDLAEGHAEIPARFVLPFEKRFLAGKIGCSPVNLSRAFATLRAVGVETQREVVLLRDVAALRAFTFRTSRARA